MKSNMTISLRELNDMMQQLKITTGNYIFTKLNVLSNLLYCQNGGKVFWFEMYFEDLRLRHGLLQNLFSENRDLEAKTYFITSFLITL